MDVVTEGAVKFLPTREDTVAAYRLHFRSQRFRLGFIAFVVVTGGAAVFATTDRSIQALFVTIVMTVVGYGVPGAVIWFVVLPWWVGRIYRQQRNLHEEVAIEWDSSELRARVVRGQVQTPWCHYVKRRQDGRVILLYQSDALFQFIPRRVLSAEQAAALEACLMQIGKR